jgi:hypothetical protein
MLPNIDTLKLIDNYLNAPVHQPINFKDDELYAILNFIRENLAEFSLDDLSKLSEEQLLDLKTALREDRNLIDDDYVQVFASVLRKMIPLGVLKPAQAKKVKTNPWLYIAMGLSFGLSFCTLPLSFTNLLHLTFSPIVGLITTGVILLSGTLFTAERVRRSRRPHIERLRLANIEFELRHANNRKHGGMQHSVADEISYGYKFWKWPWMNKFAWIRVSLTSGLGLSATIIGTMITIAKFAGISALVASALGPAAPFAIGAIGIALALALAACLIYAGYKKYLIMQETKAVEKMIKAEIKFEKDLEKEYLKKPKFTDRKEFQAYANHIISESIIELGKLGQKASNPEGTDFIDTFFKKDSKEAHALSEQWTALRTLRQQLQIKHAAKNSFSYAKLIKDLRISYPILDPILFPNSVIAKRLEKIIKAERGLKEDDGSKDSGDKSLHQ